MCWATVRCNQLACVRATHAGRGAQQGNFYTIPCMRWQHHSALSCWRAECVLALCVCVLLCWPAEFMGIVDEVGEEVTSVKR